MAAWDVRTAYRQLVEELYNGDLTLAEALVSADFRLNIPGAPAGCYRGPDGLRALIGGARAPFTTLRFQIVLGPIIADDLLAARWRADGIYGGGISAAKVPAGTASSFGGHDFLRFRDDRFIEFWGGADDSHLMSQLGLFQGG